MTPDDDDLGYQRRRPRERRDGGGLGDAARKGVLERLRHLGRNSRAQSVKFRSPKGVLGRIEENHLVGPEGQVVPYAGTTAEQLREVLRDGERHLVHPEPVTREHAAEEVRRLRAAGEPGKARIAERLAGKVFGRGDFSAFVAGQLGSSGGPAGTPPRPTDLAQGAVSGAGVGNEASGGPERSGGAGGGLPGGPGEVDAKELEGFRDRVAPGLSEAVVGTLAAMVRGSGKGFVEAPDARGLLAVNPLAAYRAFERWLAEGEPVVEELGSKDLPPLPAGPPPKAFEPEEGNPLDEEEAPF